MMSHARTKRLCAMLLITVAGVLSGCTSLASSSDQQPTDEAGGCNPQVAAGYRLLTSVPTGTLEIFVRDASGSPQASVSVTAYRLVPTGARCLSMIDGVTDAQGLLRFERMKTGPYQVSLDGATATASVELEADRTAKVTLVD
jgi:hypothetical protein